MRGDEALDFSGGSLRLFLPCGGESAGNNGICVLASAGEYDILMIGDLNHHGAQDWLLAGTMPQAELLVAGHHGAENSTGFALLAHVQPEAVIISVGKNNTYGHPAARTLRRIRLLGAHILRTDECGTITVTGNR